jgi:hypothetical protein
MASPSSSCYFAHGHGNDSTLVPVHDIPSTLGSRPDRAIWGEEPVLSFDHGLAICSIQDRRALLRKKTLLTRAKGIFGSMKRFCLLLVNVFAVCYQHDWHMLTGCHMTQGIFLSFKYCQLCIRSIHFRSRT